MKRHLLLSVMLCGLTSLAGEPEGVHWPMFRGPGASGVGAGPPASLRWDVASGAHVRWQVAVPGLGHASPVVWGDHLFVLTAVGAGEEAPLRVGLYGDVAPVPGEGAQRWVLYCHDKWSGEVRWHRTVHEGEPAIKRHTKASHANATPATDGSHVVVLLGSEGLHCYDMAGTKLWQRDLGVLDSGFYRMPDAQWGYGSSPIIHGRMVLVQCDVQKDGFLAAFQVEDGAPIWRTARVDVPTWSTPNVWAPGDGAAPHLVVNGFRRIGGYDLETGQLIWWLRGRGDIPVPTPVFADGLAFISNAHAGSGVFAIRWGAVGDVSLDGSATVNEHVAWSVRRGGAYMQTPLVHRGLLYVCRDNGALTCFDAASGDVLYRAQLGDRGAAFTASPVASGERIYFTGETGDVHVIAAGPTYEHLAVNRLGAVCLATPAISEGHLFFRTRSHLLAIAPAAASPR